jgi:hypothetical protein
MEVTAPTYAHTYIVSCFISLIIKFKQDDYLMMIWVHASLDLDVVML